MPPQDPIDKILGCDSTLARWIESFESRPSQIEMARLIRRALQEKNKVIIEAGTGTGKTLGYLVPLVMAGKKTVISTGTKNLQEQIIFKDIPLLGKALGEEVQAIMMKGRKNYLCLHRFHQYFSRPKMGEQNTKKKMDRWRTETTFGDFAELTWMREDDPLRDAVSSSSEQCLGSECLHWDDCFLNRLRQKALQAQIVIVNHHLFFADLIVKKGGFGEIIPRFQVAVFDEAHALEEIATTYFGKSLSTNQLLEFTADLEREMEHLRGGERKDIQKRMESLRAGSERLWELFRQGEDRGRLTDQTMKTLEEGVCHEIRRALSFIQQKSGFKESGSVGRQALAERAGDLSERLDEILVTREPGWLKWYEKRKKTLVIHASPLDISHSMRESLYEKVKTLVFTSATLSTAGNFEYFCSRMGLEKNVLQGIYPSHFNFKEQALLYVPQDLPVPQEAFFVERLGRRIEKILRITAGRALVLFTSYNNLNGVHGFLKGRIPYTLFKQGEAPRSTLLEEFKKDTHSVLLATGSFWQGVDVPGEALSCLIVDKLPFDSPGDPLVAARIDLVRSRGGNPFMEYQLPSAIIALKQGLGRLIRKSTDRGVFSVLDVRMIRSRYGRSFFESLPEIPLTQNLEDLHRFFEPR
ncbi:MAG: ATP-dependent DNA helicase [Deltaproteobacteria bacterium]|nr:ATP-dependent DNA helicase [Deltaproteobacteria bacterium]